MTKAPFNTIDDDSHEDSGGSNRCECGQSAERESCQQTAAPHADSTRPQDSTDRENKTLILSAGTTDITDREWEPDGAPAEESEATCPPTRLSASSADNLPTEQRDPADAGGDFPVIPGFNIVALLGRGGMGHVFRAIQQHPVRRQVALKVIRTRDPSCEAVARFLAERQAMALMDHENIAHVFDAGLTSDGSPWFSMELAENATSITRFSDQQQLTIEQRLNLFLQACRAVQHAHHRGIIHRDLKPSNILVTSKPDGPLVKVIDFGLAKSTDAPLHEAAESQTEAGQVLGTPEYMSPDQVRLSSSEIDTRTDVYSLGVLLYELLTGRTPLGRARIRTSGIHEILMAIVEEEHTPPSVTTSVRQSSEVAARRGLNNRQLQRRLQGDLDSVVGKALQKERSERYDSPASLFDDLQRHLQHEVISARPAGPGDRLWKVFQRHTLIMTGVGLMSLAIVLGLLTFGSLWLHVSELNQQNASLAAQKSAEVIRATAALAESEQLRARITISVSHAQWEDGDAKAALRSLWSIPPGCRNIEWGLLNQRYQGHTTLLYGHHSGVTCLGLRADGRMFASGGWDGIVECRAAQKPYKTLHRLSHDGEVRDLDFSPDGTWLLTCPGNGGLLWDSESGRCVREFETPADMPRLQCCCFSKDGQTVYLGTEDGRLLHYETQSGRLKSQEAAHQDAVLKCRCTSTSVLSIGADNTLVVRPHTGEVHRIALDPLQARCLAVHENSQKIAIAGVAGVIQIRDLQRPEVISTLRSSGSTVFGVAFANDGATLCTTHFDNSILIHSLAEERPPERWCGHLAFANNLIIDESRQQIISAGEDGTVRVWHRQSRFGERQERHHSASVESICHVPQTELFVTTGFDGAIGLWHWEDGFQKRLLPPGKAGKRRVQCTENLLLVADDDGCIHRWSLAKDGLIADGLFEYTRLPACQQAEPSTESVAIVDCDVHAANRAVSLDRQGHIILWDLATCRRLALSQQSGRCVRFTPDSRVIVGGDDGEFAILSAHDLSPQRTVRPHGDKVQAAEVLQDGTVISGDRRGHVCRWSVKTGEILQRFEGHEKGIEAIAVFPDRRRFLTGSWDRTVKLWSTDEPRALLTLKQFDDSARTVCIHPDGQHIAVGCMDGSLSTWDLTRPRSRAYYCFAPGPIDDLTYEPTTGHLQAKLKNQSSVEWPIPWDAFPLDSAGLPSAAPSDVRPPKKVRLRHYQEVASVTSSEP
ncbi:MAG: serine/threonine-protein kinase [Planctomycetaceae bacterium]|nr:serine/threonine-protein kinase [Planctomycetaceae bacterium]